MKLLRLLSLTLCLGFFYHEYGYAAQIRWAADFEAGAPYVYLNPDEPGKPLGFETDLMRELGRHLGLDLKHVSISWDGLIPGLLRGNQYDLVVNGIEVTPERSKIVLFTTPYFVTSNWLSKRSNDSSIQNLADCKNKRVGTLKNAYGEYFLKKQGDIDVITYEQESNAYKDLLESRIDAVFLDAPITHYYGTPRPGVEVLKGDYGKMEYAIALRFKEEALRDKLDSGIAALAKNGTLKKIYQSYGIWNALMEKNLGPKVRTPDVRPVYFEDFQALHNQRQTAFDKLVAMKPFAPLFLTGAIKTLQVSLFSMVLAIVLGLIIALTRVYAVKPFSIAALAWVELLRGTPLILQLFLIYYGLPAYGIKLDPFVAAVVGLGLNYSACEAENYRAGLLSVPQSQVEAATALGMSRIQTIRFIILPQAIRLVLPPMTNDFIALLKDSSLVSIITMVELMKVYGQVSSMTYDYTTPGLLVAAAYVLLGMPFVWLARMIEKKYSKSFKREG